MMANGEPVPITSCQGPMLWCEVTMPASWQNSVSVAAGVPSWPVAVILECAKCGELMVSGWLPVDHYGTPVLREGLAA